MGKPVVKAVRSGFETVRIEKVFKKKAAYQTMAAFFFCRLLV